MCGSVWRCLQGKDIVHLWELGGGTFLTKMVDSVINASTLRSLSCVIVVDLSKPRELWHTLFSVLDDVSARVHPASLPARLFFGVAHLCIKTREVLCLPLIVCMHTACSFSAATRQMYARLLVPVPVTHGLAGRGFASCACTDICVLLGVQLKARIERILSDLTQKDSSLPMKLKQKAAARIGEDHPVRSTSHTRPLRAWRVRTSAMSALPPSWA